MDGLTTKGRLWFSSRRVDRRGRAQCDPSRTSTSCFVPHILRRSGPCRWNAFHSPPSSHHHKKSKKKRKRGKKSILGKGTPSSHRGRWWPPPPSLPLRLRLLRSFFPILPSSFPHQHRHDVPLGIRCSRSLSSVACMPVRWAARPTGGRLPHGGRPYRCFSHWKPPPARKQNRECPLVFCLHH